LATPAAAEEAEQLASLPLPPPPPPALADAVARDEPTRAERPGSRSVSPPPRRLPPGRFAWPVQGRVVSAFGAKGGGMVNDGMNIAAPRGTPIRAAADGTVIYAGNEVRGFGNLVLIQHQGGWVTAYGHAERLLVRQGETVRAGEEIARVGSTGAVSTPQVHFQVRQGGKPVDPAARLDRAMAGR
uniref:murein hydrolase activator EnvC family protein n=1 Tax=Elioraea rosea TaxID=2492390 RepID=UPI001183A5E5